MDENRLRKILSRQADLRQVAPHIYSVLPPGCHSGAYDSMFGTLYDRVACSRLYNRLVWGYSITDYHVLCRKALESTSAGWLLDCGCGSLAFTAKTYTSCTRRPVVLLDRSLKLLQIALSRLIKFNGRVPENMFLLHADALRLPFQPGRFGTIVSLNLLHVFEEADTVNLLQELKKVRLSEGEMYVTTLVKNNRLADRYLQMWANAGELVPRNKNQLLSLFHAAGLTPSCLIRGNLAFLHCS